MRQAARVLHSLAFNAGACPAALAPAEQRPAAGSGSRGQLHDCRRPGWPCTGGRPGGRSLWPLHPLNPRLWAPSEALRMTLQGQLCLGPCLLTSAVRRAACTGGSADESARTGHRLPSIAGLTGQQGAAQARRCTQGARLPLCGSRRLGSPHSRLLVQPALPAGRRQRGRPAASARSAPPASCSRQSSSAWQQPQHAQKSRSFSPAPLVNTTCTARRSPSAGTPSAAVLSVPPARCWPLAPRAATCTCTRWGPARVRPRPGRQCRGLGTSQPRCPCWRGTALPLRPASPARQEPHQTPPAHAAPRAQSAYRCPGMQSPSTAAYAARTLSDAGDLVRAGWHLTKPWLCKCLTTATDRSWHTRLFHGPRPAESCGVQGPALSAFEGWHAACSAARAAAPRLVDPQLSASMKRVDFVGHVANPFHRRGQPPGQAAAAVAPLRELRASVRTVPTQCAPHAVVTADMACAG